jgi:hypothetical protein
LWHQKILGQQKDAMGSWMPDDQLLYRYRLIEINIRKATIHKTADTRLLGNKTGSGSTAALG